MPNSPTNFNTTTINAGNAGQLWANVAIPAAGGKIVLGTDGTPETVANPGAIHIGMSTGGATLSLKGSTEDFFADELANPIFSLNTASDASIAFNALQVLDMPVMRLLSPYTGTTFTGTGYDGMTFGQKSLIYTSLAYIFPVQGSSTQFAVWHLYRTINTEGIGFTVTRKGMSETAATFKGYDVTGRATTDTLGSYWKMIA